MAEHRLNKNASLARMHFAHPVLTTDTKRKGVERNTTQQVVIIARNLCCMRNLYLSICDELFSTGSLQSGNPCFGTARRTRRSQQLHQQRGKKVGGKLYKCFRFDFCRSALSPTVFWFGPTFPILVDRRHGTNSGTIIKIYFIPPLFGRIV